MSIEFHRTQMGRRFFESTLPQLVSGLVGLRKDLAELTKTIAERSEAKAQRDEEVDDTNTKEAPVRRGAE